MVIDVWPDPDSIEVYSIECALLHILYSENLSSLNRYIQTTDV